jgi:hypothetical protein
MAKTAKKKSAKTIGKRKKSTKTAAKKKVTKVTKKKASKKKVAAAALSSGPRGNPGADSLSVVKQALVNGAENFYGAMPRFWGRYFKGPGNTSPQQYHAAEGLVLRSNGIRLLPIGRQTTSVGGTEAKGRSDGEDNANAILGEVASVSGDVLVFLDVEQSHPLSRTYYRGWVDGIQGVGASNLVNFIPCVYGSFSANPTWTALAAEFANGVPCGGVWIARYMVANGCTSMPAWSDTRTRPPALPAGVPVLAWQYAQNCHSIDLNQCNPNHEADFLAGLIAP